MLTVNQFAPSIITNSISNQKIDLENYKGKNVWIKFHRFSGCPVCQYQIHEVIERQQELNKADIETLIFIHSSQKNVKSNFKEVQGLHIIDDKQKDFYKLFDSKFSWKGLLSLKTWTVTFESIFKGFFPHLNKFEGGIFGIPSDFLLNQEGRIVDLNYGKHYGDSWSVSEVLLKLKTTANTK